MAHRRQWRIRGDMCVDLKCFPDEAKKELLMRVNRPFPEITGKDNLTVFSYSGRVNIIIGCFHIALFSALEQTHCAHVACDSE